MFEALATFQWQDCRSRYDRVRQEIEGSTDDLAKKDVIYKILWDHGGRCDCTVGRNIVDKADVCAEVQQEITKVLEGPTPAPRL